MSVNVNDLRKELDEYGARCSLEGETQDGTPVDVAAAERIMKELDFVQKAQLPNELLAYGIKSDDEVRFIHLLQIHMAALGFKQIDFNCIAPDDRLVLYIRWCHTKSHDYHPGYHVVYKHIPGSNEQGKWFITWGYNSVPYECFDNGNLWKNLEGIEVFFDKMILRQQKE